MTTRYLRPRLSFAASLASDYSRPFIQDQWEQTFSTLDETPYQIVECAAGVALTVTTSHLTSVAFLAVYNESSANYVTAAWTNNAIANQQQIPYGGWLTLVGSTTTVVMTAASNLTLTANSTDAICRVFIGAT